DSTWTTRALRSTDPGPRLSVRSQREPRARGSGSSSVPPLSHRPTTLNSASTVARPTARPSRRMRGWRRRSSPWGMESPDSTLYSRASVRVKGALGEGVLPSVLRELYVGRKTGVLRFTQGAARRNVRFVKGSIVHAASEAPEEHLGEVLVRLGRLTRADLDR